MMILLTCGLCDLYVVLLKFDITNTAIEALGNLGALRYLKGTY